MTTTAQKDRQVSFANRHMDHSDTTEISVALARDGFVLLQRCPTCKSTIESAPMDKGELGDIACALALNYVTRDDKHYRALDIYKAVQ
jgi:hypothetical protein